MVHGLFQALAQLRVQSDVWLYAGVEMKEDLNLMFAGSFNHVRDCQTIPVQFQPSPVNDRILQSSVTVMSCFRKALAVRSDIERIRAPCNPKACPNFRLVYAVDPYRVVSCSFPLALTLRTHLIRGRARIHNHTFAVMGEFKRERICMSMARVLI